MNEPNKPLGMPKCTNQVHSNICMHANQLLPCLARRRGMSYMWGCINSYWRSQVCSTHFLACKISSHQVAWWKCSLIDHRCPHSQLQCHPFIDDLLWNDALCQCAWFLNVEPDYWWASLHFHYHIVMSFACIWFQSHPRLLSSITIVHNNFPPKCILPRPLRVRHHFAS